MADDTEHNAPVPKAVRGTREWAVAGVNCCRGCPHDCRYCYARYELVEKRKEVDVLSWPKTAVISKEVEAEHPLFDGTVMFPTKHDIVPENLEACLQVLTNLLVAGNRVLIVSKPHLSCIERICSALVDYRQQVLFRFTITARNDKILSFWEPHAPSYAERLACLRLALRLGFDTSVSVEPMLDIPDVEAMVAELSPHVNHSIWLGKMNKVRRRVIIDSPEVEAAVARIEDEQRDSEILALYERLKHIDTIRWKESVKEIVGLPTAPAPGLDI